MRNLGIKVVLSRRSSFEEPGTKPQAEGDCLPVGKGIIAVANGRNLYRLTNRLQEVNYAREATRII